MCLSFLQIQKFRNLANIEIYLNEKCNLFFGNNGSGKTSLLEAIHYLILGKSFRSHLIRRVISYNQDSFTLFGKILQEKILTPVGVTRGLSFGKKIKIAGNNASSIIGITKLLPLQLLNHNNYKLLCDTAKTRRQFIDWGLFHVEQSFLEVWRKIERILEQRNIALRNKAPINYLTAWDTEFVALGALLHGYRKKYIEQLSPVFQDILIKLECDFAVDISYYAGWDISNNLDHVLRQNIQKDLQIGYTTAGPHRADLHITTNKILAKDYLSRGQQKLLLCGLKIAQGVLLQQTANKSCLYLIDDIMAELDTHKCQLIANILTTLPQTQLFITGLESKPLETLFSNPTTNHNSIFHIQNGDIIPATTVHSLLA